MVALAILRAPQLRQRAKAEGVLALHLYENFTGPSALICAWGNDQ
jgi:hypothetical protein